MSATLSPDFYAPDYTLEPCDDCIARYMDAAGAQDGVRDAEPGTIDTIDVQEHCADIACEHDCHVHDPAEIDFDDFRD